MTPSFSEPFNLYYKLVYSQLVADLLVKLVKWMFTLKMYHLYTNVMLKAQLQPTRFSSNLGLCVDSFYVFSQSLWGFSPVSASLKTAH